MRAWFLRVLCRVLGHVATPVVVRLPFQRRGHRSAQLRAVIEGWCCTRCTHYLPTGPVVEARDA